MSAWSHIIVEGYCTYHYSIHKKQTCYQIINLKKFKTKKLHPKDNPMYVPKAKEKRPSWCRKENRKRIPQFRCLCDRNNKRCPFFAMVNVTKKEYRMFFEGWEKMFQEEK